MKSIDLLNKKFEKKMGGYKISDVDSFIVEAASLFTQQERENAELKHKYETMQAKLAQYEKDQDSLREALLSAQRLADNIVREAQEKAKNIERDAAVRASGAIEQVQDEIIAEQEKLARMKREVTAFRSKLMNIYRNHIELINDIPHDEPRPATARQEQPEPAKAEAPVGNVQAEEEEKQTESEAGAARMEEAPPAAEEEDINVLEVLSAKVQPEEEKSGADNPKEENLPAGEQPDSAAVAEKTAFTEEEPIPEVKLNVRFDEKSGEYIPLTNNRDKTRRRNE